MNYYTLKSIISASKNPLGLEKPSSSFSIANKPEHKYIEPTFNKDEFGDQRPSVILISAAGATGKTALAQNLSYELSLPLLDLSKHKPVGVSTLTGLIAESYKNETLGNILNAIENGNFGIIIDGIDEGRAKVTEKAFEAFLDDIAQRCKGKNVTSFILLGRTNVLDDCWLYLSEKGISLGLLSIQPFDLENAKKYIDTMTEGLESRFVIQYSQARDSILSLLSNSFRGQEENTNEFLPFIGYPPVLDAVSTLLKETRDYHQISDDITKLDTTNIEIELLTKICTYILLREKEQKVLPSIISPLITDMPDFRKEYIRQNTFTINEQCQRLIAYCLGNTIKLSSIPETAINDVYEKHLQEFFPTHPFITQHNFRNVVFESFVISTLILSNEMHFIPTVLEYVYSHKYNYHLIYFLNYMAKQHPVHSEYLSVILGAAYELRSSNVTVDVHVDSSQPENDYLVNNLDFETDIEIESIGKNNKQNRFSISFENEKGKRISLGKTISSTHIWLPCEVMIDSPLEIELSAPVYIEAESIIFSSRDLIVRNLSKSTDQDCVELIAKSISSTLLSVKNLGTEFFIILPRKIGVTFPLYQYVVEADVLASENKLDEKYLRLKRILVEFRAHNRGQLARLKAKIENPRILRNEIGTEILQKLVEEGILILKGTHYYLDMDKLGDKLGVSWQDLRTNKVNPKLVKFFNDIGKNK